MSKGLTYKLVDSTPLSTATSRSKTLNLSLDQSARYLIIKCNELVSLINSFNDSLSCSQIKNISSKYFHQAFNFFLALLGIFSARATIKSIVYDGANFVSVVSPHICFVSFNRKFKTVPRYSFILMYFHTFN